MTRKHSVVIGAITGLVVGIIMFAIGIWLRYAPEPFVLKAFLFIHAPGMGLLSRLHESAYDWNTAAGLSQVLAMFLGYWTLPGALAGLGWRTVLSRRHTSLVA